MTTKPIPARRPFIPALRAHIVNNVTGAPEAIESSIDRWSDGETEPTGPFESAVWAVCDKVAQDLDEQGEAGS